MYTIRAKIKFHSKDTAKTRYAGTYSTGNADTPTRPTWLRLEDSHIEYFSTISDAEEWFNQYGNTLTNEVDVMENPEIAEVTCIPVKLLAKRQNRYNIGDCVRAKIHYENDPRTEVTATISGIEINADKSVIYKIHFEPSDWDKKMGATGNICYISESDIIS